MNCNNSGSILFFDSGIGGVPYLSHLRDRLPGEDFIYIADSKNFPYGEKDKNQLISILTTTIGLLIERFNPKIIVIACNTASVTALKDLRSITSIPIVGVVPAIKTAAQQEDSDRIGILATKRTISGEYLQDLINKFSGGKEVVKLGASGIVTFVENDYFNSENHVVRKYIKDSVSHLLNNKVDSVVLGCTHFIHVEKEIKDAFNQKVKIIDSREGVTNQIIRVLNSNLSGKTKGSSCFYQTMMINRVDNYKLLCKKEGLEYKGELILD